MMKQVRDDGRKQVSETLEFYCVSLVPTPLEGFIAKSV
jgi:hypothetical protein